METEYVYIHTYIYIYILFASRYPTSPSEGSLLYETTAQLLARSIDGKRHVRDSLVDRSFAPLMGSFRACVFDQGWGPWALGSNTATYLG